jgi:cysteine desulfurase family protein (TIGR01976 family)
MELQRVVPTPDFETVLFVRAGPPVTRSCSRCVCNSVQDRGRSLGDARGSTSISARAVNRHRFPGLKSGWTRLDGPAGSQVLDTCAQAVASYLLGPSIANLDAPSAASQATSDLLMVARHHVAELLGGDSDGVVFGGSASILIARFANAIGAELKAGDEIICTALDHDANVSPWLDVAAHSNVHIKIAQPDPDSLELEAKSIESLLTPKTRWVAITAASNVNGATPDLGAIGRIVHSNGSHLFVDGVHAIPHRPCTLARCGADAIVCSAYKSFGPHMSALCVRPDLLQTLKPDRIRPGPAAGPRAWERGALPFELLPGVVAACKYLFSLDWNSVHQHEAALLNALVSGLQELPGVALVGNPQRRTSTVAFTVAGHDPYAIAKALAQRRVAIGSGNFYAVELFKRLPFTSCLRAGILHYNDMDDVHRLLDGLSEVIASKENS